MKDDFLTKAQTWLDLDGPKMFDRKKFKSAEPANQ